MDKVKHCEIYDACYDREGNWTEKKCGDSRCFFCPRRPEKHEEKCRCLKNRKPRNN